MTNDFIISWDCYGLEALVDISGKRSKATFATLAGTKAPDLPELSAMLLRARMNPQRNYEVYALVCDEDITEETLRFMFEHDPQGTVNLIRERGVKLYSDRKSGNKRVIE